MVTSLARYVLATLILISAAFTLFALVTHQPFNAWPGRHQVLNTPLRPSNKQVTTLSLDEADFSAGNSTLGVRIPTLD